MSKTAILQQLLLDISKNLEADIKDIKLLKKVGNEKLSVSDHMNMLYVGAYNIPNNDFYCITFKDVMIGHFYLTTMLHCCGIAVLHGVNISLTYRKKGLFKSIVEFAKKLSNYECYTILLCTTKELNIPSKVVTGFDWKIIHSFTNKRTHNKVNISIFPL